MHRLLSRLAARGHDVRCLVVRHAASELDGVRYAKRSIHGRREWWAWCDVAVTQQASSATAVRFAGEFDKPLVHWSHNWMWLDAHPEVRPDDPTPNLVAWNTRALAEAQGRRWAGRSLVLHPPVCADEHRTTPGELVTLVNVSDMKGGPLLWQLADTLADTGFLAVCGGWGDQIDAHGRAWPHPQAYRPVAAAAPANVTVIPTTTDMRRDVWARTRVLLVPTGRVSDQQDGESYGLVAAEAICSGIPVVAHPGPGVREVLGDAGIWVDRADTAGWVAALRRLADPDEWAGASAAVTARARMLDSASELDAFEAALTDLSGRRR